MTRTIRVQTSCGKEFNTPVNQMTDWQLEGLLQQNGDRTDLDPSDLLDLQAIRAELQRRQKRFTKGTVAS